MNNITKKIALVSLLLLLASCGKTVVDEPMVDENLNDTWIEYNENSAEDFIIEEDIPMVEEDIPMAEENVPMFEEDATMVEEDATMVEDPAMIDGTVDLNSESN
jgi:hypothetical protein